MTLKIVKGKVHPIGIDLGTSAIKMAQLRTVGDTIELVAAGATDFPEKLKGNAEGRLSFAAKAIRKLVVSNAFKGRDCLMDVPADATFVHHVKIPKVPPDQVREAVLKEVQGKLPFPAENAEIRHIIAGDVVGDGKPRQEVIIVAAARSTVDAYLNMARRAKLDVVGLNIEPCAIVECFGRLFRRASDLKRTILFIDMGQATTQVVLSHGSQLAFARNLSFAGDRLDQALAAGLKIPPDQAARIRRELSAESEGSRSAEEVYGLLAKSLDELADELTQCLRYYESVFRNQAIERAIFLGGQARDKRLCQAIAQRLNLPAQIGDPLVRVSCDQGAGVESGLDRRQPQPHWAVAVGLSLGGAQVA